MFRTVTNEERVKEVIAKNTAEIVSNRSPVFSSLTNARTWNFSIW